MRVVLISLEPWDEVWRRNQHFAAQLIGQRLVDHVTFVQPPLMRGGYQAALDVPSRVSLVSPHLLLPKRAGGLRTAFLLDRSVLRGADVIWVNDPAFGVLALGRGRPAVYDITDDWREFSFPPRIIRRIVSAEDRLAVDARTVACSEPLRERWRARYGVEAALVQNGVDDAAFAGAQPRRLIGEAPHVGYIGTLHSDRLDVDLLCRLARDDRVGTVHLVGPNALDEESLRRLNAESRVVLHGPVPAAGVPGWMMAMDVLLCPHRVTDFTLSLDAIKAREYVASGRPVVATPTSGFQLMSHPRVAVAERADWVDTVVGVALASRAGSAVGAFSAGAAPIPAEWTWAARARAFHRELLAAAR